MKVLLTLIRLYLRILARVAPRTAGRQAYRLFCTPRRRATVSLEGETVMARAARIDVQAEGHRVAAYRGCAPDPLSPAPRVMLVHGWESRAAFLAVWVDPLQAAGFEVVAFDAPAHGASAGRRANAIVFAQAMTAIVERFGPVSACIGHSLGGFASLLAVAGGRLFDREGLEVQRLLIFAGAEIGGDFMTMFCEFLGLGDDFLPLFLAGAAEAEGHPISEFEAHRLFADHPIPTLWLHDPEDNEVPIEGAERVARACPHVTLERISGLGHDRIACDPTMIRRGPPRPRLPRRSRRRLGGGIEAVIILGRSQEW